MTAPTPAGASGTPASSAPGVNLRALLEEMIERHATVIALGRVVAWNGSTLEPLVSFRGGFL